MTPPRQRFYNSTGDGYESGRYGDRHMEGYRAFRDDTLLAILKEAFPEQQLRILEVGCGTGLSLDYLACVSSGYSVFGIDASETMLRQAARKAEAASNPPKLTLGDAMTLPYAQAGFDVVFATRFIHQFPHNVKRQLWKEFQRVTRSGGLIILEFYARPYHWLRYYLGARKGRSHETYFLHYPSKAEVKDIVGTRLQIHPLRLIGSRLIAGIASEGSVRRATEIGGRLGGGMLLDEYFVVARKG